MGCKDIVGEFTRGFNSFVANFQIASTVEACFVPFLLGYGASTRDAPTAGFGYDFL